MEIFKDIQGYENLYQVSNTGKVRSLNMQVWCGFKYYEKQGRFLNPSIHSTGYYKVALSKNGKMKSFVIHRLVALMFIDNPDNKDYVNHKDRNRLNNHVENLEWVTQRENSIHRYIGDPKKTSKHIGVFKWKSGDFWIANLTIDKKPIRKYCKTEEEARLVYLSLLKDNNIITKY